MRGLSSSNSRTTIRSRTEGRRHICRSPVERPGRRGHLGRRQIPQHEDAATPAGSASERAGPHPAHAHAKGSVLPRRPPACAGGGCPSRRLGPARHRCRRRRRVGCAPVDRRRLALQRRRHQIRSTAPPKLSCRVRRAHGIPDGRRRTGAEPALTRMMETAFASGQCCGPEQRKDERDFTRRRRSCAAGRTPRRSCLARCR